MRGTVKARINVDLLGKLPAKGEPLVATKLVHALPLVVVDVVLPNVQK